MKEQEKVAAFVRDHDLAAPPEYRLLDLISELGEVAKDAVESTGTVRNRTNLLSKPTRSAMSSSRCSRSPNRST